MTAPPVFRVSATATQPVAHVALVSITVSARAIVFTDVRCPNCRRRIMSVPGTPVIDVRAVRTDADRSGRGRVLGCKRCSTLCEVIEHHQEGR